MIQRVSNNQAINQPPKEGATSGARLLSSPSWAELAGMPPSFSPSLGTSGASDGEGAGLSWEGSGGERGWFRLLMDLGIGVGLRVRAEEGSTESHCSTFNISNSVMSNSGPAP